MTTKSTLSTPIAGMTCQGCVNAVTRIVKRADPQAEVKIDLASGRADVKTAAEAQVIAKAISAGGYEAQAR